MATTVEQGLATDAMLLRLIYERPTFREGDVWQAGTFLAPRRSTSPVLVWAAACLSHANEYLTASTVLAQLESGTGTPLPDPPTDVVRISMQSPLVILVPLLLPQVVAYGWALIKLAERICTFGPRVSRRRQQDLLAAATAREERQQLERDADAVAQMIEAAGSASRLARADLVSSQDDDDDDLVEVADPDA